MPVTATFGRIDSGASGSITFPATFAGASQASISLQSRVPSGDPLPQSKSRHTFGLGGAVTPIAYVSVTAAQSVSFGVAPEFDMAFPAGTLSGNAYVAFYDSSNPTAGWTALQGPVPAAGTTLVIAQQPLPTIAQFSSNVSYVYAIVETGTPLPTPTPPPTPSPSPAATSSATPTASPTASPTVTPTASPTPASCVPQMRARTNSGAHLLDFPVFAHSHAMPMYSRGYLRSHPGLAWGPNARHAMRGFDRTNDLTYGGGAVQTSPELFLVFWGWQGPGDTNADPLGESSVLLNFFSSIAGNGWINIDTQYYQLVNGTAQCINNPATLIAGVWYDSSPPPNPYSESDVAGEANRAMEHFGYSPNANYFVATPTRYTTPGFVQRFCAYHTVQYTGNNPVAYTVFPYVPDAGSTCGAGAVNSPGPLDGVSIVGGHEEAETQTDPVPGYGWGGPQGEIADECAWQGLEANPQAEYFPTQPLWDNLIGNCAQSGP